MSDDTNYKLPGSASELFATLSGSDLPRTLQTSGVWHLPASRGSLKIGISHHVQSCKRLLARRPAAQVPFGEYLPSFSFSLPFRTDHSRASILLGSPLFRPESCTPLPQVAKYTLGFENYAIPYSECIYAISWRRLDLRAFWKAYLSAIDLTHWLCRSLWSAQHQCWLSSSEYPTYPLVSFSL